MHAYAIRASAYKTVAKALTPFGKGVKVVSGPGLHTCDERLSELCGKLPVYAAWPNLAGKRPLVSEAQKGWINDNYTADGRQTYMREAVESLDAEMRERFSAARTVSRAPAHRVGAGKPGSAESFLLCRSEVDVGFGDRLRGLAAVVGGLDYKVVNGPQEPPASN